MDLTHIERDVAAIEGVEAARVGTDDQGNPTSVHVVASEETDERAIGLQVRLVLKSSGIDLPASAVNVVRLRGAGGGDGKAPRPARVALHSVSCVSTPVGVEATVSLLFEGAVREGIREGPSGTALRTVATAALDALGGVLGDTKTDVEETTLQPIGSYVAAATLLRVVTLDGERHLLGSSLVRDDPTDAVARSVLAALNRLLP